MSSESAPLVPLSSPACRVLIADDHPIVRASVRALLETTSSIQVVAEAEDGEAALARIVELKPDVALVDIGMPKLDGIEVARRLAGSDCRTRVVALTAFEDGRHVRDCLAAGAAGFVPKSAAASDLFAAIRAVLAGGHYVHPRLVSELVGLTPARPPSTASLSPRENDVLRLIAFGFSNKEIGARLAVSVKTVETYKARAMEKIDAKSRVDIVRFATKQGWFDKEASS